MQDAARPVHVAAAERDDAARRAMKQAHQLARLRAGAENQIDDDDRSRRAQRVGMIPELPPVPDDLVFRTRCAAVKDDDIVPLPFQCARDLRPDETAPTDEKNTHNQLANYGAAGYGPFHLRHQPTSSRPSASHH